MPPDEPATVRSATAADMPAISRLAARLVRQHHSLDPERFMLFEPVEPSYERYLTGELNDPDAVVLAAVRGETVVGYAYGRMEPRDWNALRDSCGALHDIYVDESVRREGVARLLLGEMIGRLAAKGAPRVVLMTASGNTAAQRLFEQVGFRRTMIEMTLETTAK